MWPSIVMLGLPFGSFKIGDVDQAEVGDVSEVERDRLAHEQLERHLVDGLAVRVGVKEGVQVGADIG